MFSTLARGVGTWSGGLKLQAWDDNPEEKPRVPVLPTLSTVEEDHRHGHTISPRNCRSAATNRSHTEKPDGELILPKTFITRKGALVLFVAPEEIEHLSEQDKSYMRKYQRFLKKRYGDQLKQLGKLSRLAQSILMYGDENYEHESASISDTDNKIFLKFLHDLDSKNGDLAARPGSDLSFYLRDLKSRATSAQSRYSAGPSDAPPTNPSDCFWETSHDASLLSADTESLASRFIRPASATSSRTQDDRSSTVLGSAGNRSVRVLSADKLAASLKSASYLGRPCSTPHDERFSTPYTPSSSRRSSVTSGASRQLLHRRRVSSATDKPSVTLGNDQAVYIPLHSTQDLVHRADTPLEINLTVPYQASIPDSSPTNNNVQLENGGGVMVGAISEGMDLIDVPISEGGYGEFESIDASNSLSDNGEKVNTPALSQGQVYPEDSAVVVDCTKSDEVEGQASSYDMLISVEEVSGIDQVKRYLEDIQSEVTDLSNEAEEDKHVHHQGDTPYDQDDRADGEDFEEEYLDDAAYLEDAELFESGHGQENMVVDPVTQPLAPLYSVGLLTSASAGQFSIDSTQAENVREEDIIIEQLPDNVREEDFIIEQLPEQPTTNLDDASHSLQVALQSLEDHAIDEEEGVRGVTSVEVSRCGSAASSHSGLQCESASATSRRRRSKVEEPGDYDHQMAPRAPPSTRSCSPNLESDMVTMEAVPKATPEVLADAEDILQSDQAWEDLKSESEKAQAESKRSSVVRVDDDILENIKAVVNTEVVDEDNQDEKLDGGVTVDQNLISESKPHVESVDNDGKGDVTIEDKSMDDETYDNHGESSDLVASDAKSNLVKDGKKNSTTKDKNLDKKPKKDKSEDMKINKTDKKEESETKKKQKDESKGKESSRTTLKKDTEVKEETPKKEYTKVLDVAKMRTPDKKEKVKKEPLVKESKPDTLVKDTRKELEKLFPSPPKKPETKKAASTPVPKIKKIKEPPGMALFQPSPPPQKSKQELELDKLEKEVKNIIGSGGPEDTELTAEEMEIEKQLLKERLQEAEAKIKGESPKTPRKVKSAASSKQGSPRGKKAKVTPRVNEKEEMANQREALKEARKLEKLKRLEEAKQLEDQIKLQEEEKQKELEQGARNKQHLEEDIEDMRREAEEARQMEEEAREQMAQSRKVAREEREARRKAELEKRKHEANKRRDHERSMVEAAKKKEKEMLDRIADAEQKRMMGDEARRREEEEELMEQIQRENEEMEIQRQLEDEEEQLRELELQAEEEAVAFLVKEREEAEKREWALKEQARQLQQDLHLKEKHMLEEQRALEEQQRLYMEEETRRRQEEQRRFDELKAIEQEALDRMHSEMEARRAAALRRREQNLERRANLGRLNHGQGLTRPWTFTYYVHWPRETYEKLMGEDPKKKGFRAFGRKPKPKK